MMISTVHRCQYVEFHPVSLLKHATASFRIGSHDVQPFVLAVRKLAAFDFTGYPYCSITKHARMGGVPVLISRDRGNAEHGIAPSYAMNFGAVRLTFPVDAFLGAVDSIEREAQALLAVDRATADPSQFFEVSDSVAEHLRAASDLVRSGRDWEDVHAERRERATALAVVEADGSK